MSLSSSGGPDTAKDNLRPCRRRLAGEEQEEQDRRRVRYAITEKGREDILDSFGKAALKGGRRLYSTCLSGENRRRQPVRRARAENSIAKALETEARRLFAGVDTAALSRQFIASGGFGTPRRVHKRSPFRARLRRELLGQDLPSEEVRQGDEPKRRYG